LSFFFKRKGAKNAKEERNLQDAPDFFLLILGVLCAFALKIPCIVTAE